MTAAYFTTRDGAWFQPTDHCRGPWDPDACHAGPPVALMVRSLESLEISKRLARITVEINRPIPMAGFRVRSQVQRQGRSTTTSKAEILDDDKVYVTAHAIHVRFRDDYGITTAPHDTPSIANAVPGHFPIREKLHELPAFTDSLEVLFDPEGSLGSGGPTTMWMRSLPILAGEEASGFQRICPLADSGNGISYNQYLDKTLFINADLTLSLHREPMGDWFCSRSRSHWELDGTGLTDAELFDTRGSVGRALQTLLLNPAQQRKPI